MLDEEPVRLRFYEREGTVKLVAAEGERQLSLLDALEHAAAALFPVIPRQDAVLIRRVYALIPDDDLAAAVLALRDHAFEGSVFVRMVFRHDGEPPDARV